MKSVANRSLYVMVASAACAIAGCGRAHEEVAAPVAARVNSTEITVRQIDYLAARSSNGSGTDTANARRAILDKLINDELLREQAVGEGLDKSSSVQDELKLTQTEVLAQSYLHNVAAGVRKPTDGEIRAYYIAHPELFTQRRIFHVDQIDFAASETEAAGVRDFVSGAHTVQDIAAWLKARKIAFSETSAVRAAEQVPLDLLPAIQAMKDGQIAIVSSEAGRVRIVQIIASKVEPVAEAVARPRIREYLYNRRVSESIAADLRRLRQKAKIVYLGEFAGKRASGEHTAAAPVERQLAQSETNGLDNQAPGLIK
jgi:EpsD family peptidyl-prolyl cis-trans isomerase